MKGINNRIKLLPLIFMVLIGHDRMAFGRWLSCDPLASKYSDLSPYQFAANTPIVAKDPDGKEIIIISHGKEYLYEDGIIYSYKNGKKNGEYTGNNKFVIKVKQDLDVIKAVNDETNMTVTSLEMSPNKHYIMQGSKNGVNAENTKKATNGTGTGSVIKYNSTKEEFSECSPPRKPSSGLAHEIFHAYEINFGIMDEKNRNAPKTENNIPMREVRAVNFENMVRAANGDAKRTNYAFFGCKEIPHELLHDTHNETRTDSGPTPVPEDDGEFGAPAINRRTEKDAP